MQRVIHFDFPVFDEADVYTQILTASKQNLSGSHSIKFNRVSDFDQNFEIEPLYGKQEVFLSKENFIIDIRSLTPVGKFISKIKTQYPKLEEIARASLGCQAYNSSKHSPEQIKNRVFHAEEKLSDEYLEELAGSDVGRYHFERIKGKWIKYGSWLHDYRSMDWLTGGRILIREVTGKKPYQIQASYLEETFCNYKTILNVSPKADVEYSMKLLCGILNSTLLSFIFSNSSNKIQSKSFPRVCVGDLKAFPIVVPQSEFEILLSNQIISNVSEIIHLKERNQAADTTDLENQIDHLVYQLYNLTEEEIKMIEGDGT
ncbi:hypothetical protein G9Q97_00290 [Cyclobacterium sp. GBPx2]|uniref:site-specific DNA-methyltransferase (adenine-specific) n=1 Tax=Cyclobacterium plantarum TaxID=2716263 RepID=A0ABX0H4E3_9BACT|nr:hypothetical protein [Cyclobacterium plantarum]